ncbi:MAG: hypothetical protein JSW68_07535, partial [Burkholderiales bacterium]
MPEPALTGSVSASPGAGVLGRIGSLRLARWLLAALGAAVLAAHAGLVPFDHALVGPLGLLVLNLGAALVTQPALRRQAALLAFHLGLIAVMVLVVTGRLTYLAGRIEVTSGTAFDGALIDGERGWLHRQQLHRAVFVNDGFEIDYAAGLKRGATRNRVRWTDADGRELSTVIGDHRPLVRAGYRFYTTPNKGFAPVFVWTPAAGARAERGAVHLPSYPVHADEQAHRWRASPGAPEIWVMLKIDEVLIDPERAARFRLPQEQSLIVRVADARHTLRPGEQLALPQGTLVYQELRTWMGYRVRYD